MAPRTMANPPCLLAGLSRLKVSQRASSKRRRRRRPEFTLLAYSGGATTARPHTCTDCLVRYVQGGRWPQLFMIDLLSAGICTLYIGLGAPSWRPRELGPNRDRKFGNKHANYKHSACNSPARKLTSRAAFKSGLRTQSLACFAQANQQTERKNQKLNPKLNQNRNPNLKPKWWLKSRASVYRWRARFTIVIICGLVCGRWPRRRARVFSPPAAFILGWPSAGASGRRRHMLFAVGVVSGLARSQHGRRLGRADATCARV